MVCVYVVVCRGVCVGVCCCVCQCVCGASDPSGALALTNLRVHRTSKVVIDDPVNLTGTLEVTTGGEVAVKDQVTSANIEVVNGGVLSHLPTTTTEISTLNLNAGSIIVDATGRIDVTGRGFLGGNQPGNPFGPSGMTLGFQVGSTGRSGGSYGGLGGPSSGVSNAVYGNFRDPKDPGSGGATLSGPNAPAGNGGGLIRIVAQTLQLDGLIKADGGFISCCLLGGGSGGGIRIDVGTLSGTGQITANGGNGPSNVQFSGPGGGGGRIAIYFQDTVGFDFAQVLAIGGADIRGTFNGGAGTVFLQGPGRETGELIVDNNNLPVATLSTPLPPPAQQPPPASPSALITPSS